MSKGDGVTVEGLVEHRLPWQPFARRLGYPLLDLIGVPPVALSNDLRRDAPVAVASAASDEELMRLYRGGDQESFRRLYERHRAPLMRFVRRTALDPADVEEIVQETWMAVIRGRERYEPRARFVTYLFAIARRRGMDRWRLRGRRPESQDTEALEAVAAPARMQPEALVRDEAFAAAVAAALEALPLPQREVFLLRAETDLTLEEIATVTGTTRETAKSRLRYGVHRLRAALEAWT